uniref:Uncharacterized protein n=1 Tax=Anguilla anguilla TaxID=7936 RepID=A0A0E9QA91_ANGAN
MFARGGENYLCLKTNCFAQQSARNCIRKIPECLPGKVF